MNAAGLTAKAVGGLNIIDRLLTEVSVISKKYALISKKPARIFIIFDIKGKFSDEVFNNEIIAIHGTDNYGMKQKFRLKRMGGL